MTPAGVSTAPLIVVFGSETDVRLAQEAEGALALTAGGEAAASATVCVEGARHVLATASAATMGAATADASIAGVSVEEAFRLAGRFVGNRHSRQVVPPADWASVPHALRVFFDQPPSISALG